MYFILAGSQKSLLINIIRRALNVLEKLFPSVFIKEKDDISPDLDVENRDYNLLVQIDTELGLTKTLAARVHIILYSPLKNQAEEE